MIIPISQKTISPHSASPAYKETKSGNGMNTDLENNPATIVTAARQQ
ncbi:hypothetical protein L2729_20380 [Shewanella gelidimarina]|nr:hypothetical protein [Shewanella gelidimarina]MCL1060325.1 hypothetical protein [Shewanella gelidimarina]